METYYRKQNRPGGGIRAYEDFREMLERESDIQGVVNITPDHQHGSINISALAKGRAAISHKPVASLLYEVRRTVEAAHQSTGASHLLAYSNRPDRHTLAAWINAGVIGQVREVHNWTDRPFWPQGMQEYHPSGTRAGRFQLAAVAGTRTGASLPSGLHLRGVPRMVCVRNRPAR
jgi:predicted dehydrogenase